MLQGRRRSRLLWGAALLLGGGSLAGCQSSSLAAGKLYLKQEKYDLALQQLELAAGADPQTPEVHYQLGRAYGLVGRYGDMADSFRRSLKLGPRFERQIEEERLYYWSRVYNDGVRAAASDPPDLTTARRHFGTATQVLPERLEAWRNLAVVDYQEGDTAAAVAAYERVVAADPADTTSWRNLGILYLNQQRFADAEGAFRTVVDAGDNVDALVDLAVCYAHEDRLDEAEQAYRRALALDPDQWQCHYNLGNLYWQREDHAAARTSYERAVELDPTDVDARHNLAMTYMALELFDRALPMLEALSREQPDNGVVWRELGHIYALQSRIADSEGAYQRAAELGQ